MKQLRKDGIKALNQELNDLYNLDFLSKKDKVVVNENLVYVNDSLDFFYLNEKPVPTLHYLMKNNVLKKITVDMGAVKFMINGADLMRPGVVDIEDEMNADEIVCVVDQNNQKPLCLVITLDTSEGMKAMDKGKIARNIHYVGDEIWSS